MQPKINTHELVLQLVERTLRLARNLWWTWNPDAQNLFEGLSAKTWHDSHHNAVQVMRELSKDKLITLYHDPVLREKAERVIRDFEGYMRRGKTWGATHCPQLKERPVAYFSAEFGLHESLPVYSGGLGILSGDHIKSASDLGIPFFGITLFYRQSYFTQVIDAEGVQNEIYPELDPESLPMEIVCDGNGNEVVCSLKIADTEVYFHAWRIDVGRASLYLLDTNRPENEPHWRDISTRVYGGDQTTRICQELILGVGGIRLLRKIGIRPHIHHLNEGHSSFLLVELLRERLREGLSFPQAQESVRNETVFTTHTTVAAAHDRFPRDLVDRFLREWHLDLNMSAEQFMDLGRVNAGDPEEDFCMTVLALKLTRAANAVSELNGQVCRQMWRPLYPEHEADDVPIGHITNGVHMKGWMNSTTFEFWNRTLGPEWCSRLLHTDFWEKMGDSNTVTDEDIWELRYRLKREMINALRYLLEDRQARMDTPMTFQPHKALDPEVLTVGFARRFATYKRATLLFQDMEKIASVFNSPDKSIQMVISGKAHPEDEKGKHLIRDIIQIANDPRFTGRVVFLEDYNIEIGRHLISGCDVWLNNPRRPLEASGTSGQKIAVHGGLNASILDGWWREGYDGTNGFAIGRDSHPVPVDEALQDRLDSEDLCRLFTDEIIPEFYDRDQNNIPRRWIQRIRRAMVTLIPRFNTDRMVADYTRKYYLKPWG